MTETKSQSLRPHRTSFLLFFTFLVVYFTSTVGIMNSSDAPQYALTQALVEEGTIKINHFARWIHPDYAQRNGSLYSLRPPGESFFALPFYILGKVVLPLAQVPYNQNYPGILAESKLEVLTIVFNVSFSAGAVVLLYLITLLLTNSAWAAILSSVTFGLGTLLWRYGSHFQRFGVVIFFLLLAYFTLIGINKWYRSRLIATSVFGFALGSALILDPSTIFLVAILGGGMLLTILSHRQWKCLFTLFLALNLPLAANILYTYQAFGNPLTSAYFFHATKPHLRNNLRIHYQMPLFPSLLINIWSNSPIPRSAFPDTLWNDDNFRVKESMEWATRINYKGIFTQSPYLYVSLIGFIFFWKKHRREALLALILALTYLIQTAKLTWYYGANMYDTHYFLPAVPFFSLGFGFTLVALKQSKHRLLALLGFGIVLVTLGISLFNGWESNLVNYAPHVTGEHRFSLDLLAQPLFSQENFRSNIDALLVNTFPNMVNIPLLIGFYIPLYLALYFFFSKTVSSFFSLGKRLRR